MSAAPSLAAVNELASLKSVFTRESARRGEELLGRLARTELESPQDLIRLHETVLFMRAYPRNPAVFRLTQRILSSFAQRLHGKSLDSFDDPEISGIAGSAVSTNFSFEIARGLAARHSRSVRIDWDNYEHSERLGAVLARTFPLAAEQWTVEPHVDWRAWFTSAGLTLECLLANIDPPTYDLLEIPLRWELGNSWASRSAACLPRRKIFHHDGPLLRRGDVSLEREFASAPVPTTRLTHARARAILSLIADNSAARYRELWGFTHPDDAHVYHAHLGRGVDFYFFGAAKAFRLPLRAYHCGMFSKNGVPIGYIETLSLFERAEVGFNLYYTFREGETAWLYARVLKVIREHLGVDTFSIDPYQLGHENEEAIASGAFWFYRKLGFRPVRQELKKLISQEEQKIAAVQGYRSSPSVLRRMARGPLVYGPPEADQWSPFSLEELCRRKEFIHGFDSPDLVRAKNAPEERGYLRLLRRKTALRSRLLLTPR